MSGNEAELYQVDAREAVTNCPNEWSLSPWASKDTRAATPSGAAVEAGAKAGDVAPPVTSPAPPATPSESLRKLDASLAPKVVVPPDWETLKFFALRSLAQKISGQPDFQLSKAQSEKIIRDYLSSQ